MHTGNILLQLPDEDKGTGQTDFRGRISRPTAHPVKRLDGAPLPTGVPSNVYWGDGHSVCGSEITTDHLPIMISDFGEAFEPAVTKQSEAHTLPSLMPPESLFDGEDTGVFLSFPSDIFCKGSLFETFDSSQDELLKQHVKLLGKLPEPWWTKWNSRMKHFNEDGTILVRNGTHFKNGKTAWSLERAYDWFNAFSRKSTQDLPDDNERKAFLKMIKNMLVYNPNDRATIDHVLESEWIQKWALPEKERMQHSCKKHIYCFALTLPERGGPLWRSIALKCRCSDAGRRSDACRPVVGLL